MDTRSKVKFKKKKKPRDRSGQPSGGSFCAVGECSNRSTRDKTSIHSGRGFLRYIRFPADKVKIRLWKDRMKRDTTSWAPNSNTRVCSDHFFLDDFRPDHLERFYNCESGEVRSKLIIKLRNDSIPNTDRDTGRFSDPLTGPLSDKRRPPTYKERNNSTNDDQQPQGSRLSEDEVEPLPDSEYSSISMVEDVDSDSESESESDQEENDDTADEDYVIVRDSDSDMSDMSDQGAEDECFEEPPSFSESDFVKDKASWAFVAIPLLLSLFKHCPECGARANITNIKTWGFAVLVSYRCFGLAPHNGTWRSSPVAQRKFRCNTAISAAAMMCGVSYNALESMMSCLRVPYISSTAFYKSNRRHLYPIIAKKWREMRDRLIGQLKNDGDVDVAGDGHFDSPGWCAKFCTYSLLHMASGAILEFFVCQKGQYTGDLEKASCLEVLINLKNRGLKNMRYFVTDENIKIAKLIRTSVEIAGFIKEHCYDVWHKGRLIKLKILGLAKIHPGLSDYVSPIVNHFWYSCKECAGDARVLVERFHSCLLHLTNRHAWTSDPFRPIKLKKEKEKNKKRKTPKKKLPKSADLLPYFKTEKKCNHNTRIRRRRLKGIKWLSQGSDEFKALFDYLTSTRLVKSIKKCCRFLHTGGLEVYHNVRLKLLPKRTSYSITRMIVGSMLIAIEVNRNLDRSRRKLWAYSKSQKKYVTKSRMLKKDLSYRREIMQETIQFIESGKKHLDINAILKEDGYLKKDVPRNITGLRVPAQSAANRSRYV